MHTAQTTQHNSPGFLSYIFIAIIYVLIFPPSALNFQIIDLWSKSILHNKTQLQQIGLRAERTQVCNLCVANPAVVELCCDITWPSPR